MKYVKNKKMKKRVGGDSDVLIMCNLATRGQIIYRKYKRQQN